MRIILITLIGIFCFTPILHAGGSIPWEWVHTEIQKQDKSMIDMIDKTFDVAPSGGCMRPLRGEHAGERFAPYNFFAKLKGAKGDYVFNLTFDKSEHGDQSWSVLIQKIWY